MAKSQMLINYTPGDECRVAIVRDGRLEEFFAERMNATSAVGNIAVGRVTNVESAIQAAFIDFGHEHNGFLHITDLHPRYFPGEDDDSKERVGKKTPRRDRPPIQQALKKGQEVVVQVIKEGIGTKGPTLTSYLSIPGRFLVMMPDMDKVGVSRKVEDEDERREMRKVLDQLDLPEGFGFILRTAGMGRTKTDLKRDLAYLHRLWRDMESKRKQGRAPKMLYAESDLLVRTLRDVLSSEIDEVIIDHPAALRRAANFMRIVSPRASTKLLQYDRTAPIFHAYGVEEQIEVMHSREAPLPSGGRLVIDETEALVAVDVNSGKSRSAGDAETNAVRTNLEAADEICRQLKLRDLGGLVVLDLIDMRHRSNRAKVEAQFKENFKRDRARTKVLPISPLGLIELTRQRMRGSMLNTQYVDCPTCTGFGKIQRPGFVAADGMRELGALLQHERVQKVEMVVSPRVATEYLTAKRRAIGGLEHRTGKTVEIRVSETIPLDRVTYYAYDERGADIAIDKLPRAQTPRNLKPWDASIGKGESEDWAVDPHEEAEALAEAEHELFEEEEELASDLISQDGDFTDDDKEGPPKRRRRRRGGRGRGSRSSESGDEGERQEETKRESERGAEPGEDGVKKRRRRGRRGRGGSKTEEGAGESAGAREVSEKPSLASSESRDSGSSHGRSRNRSDDGEGGAKAPARSRLSAPAAKAESAPVAAPAAPSVVRKAWGFGVATKPSSGSSESQPAPVVKKTRRRSSSKASDDSSTGSTTKKVTKKKTTKKVAKKPTAKKTTRKKAATTTKKKTTKKTATRKTSAKKTTKKRVSKASSAE